MKKLFITFVLVVGLLLPLSAFAMVTTNWVATPFPWNVNFAINRMLLQTNWAGTAEEKLAYYVTANKRNSDTWGNAVNPGWFDNGLKFAAVYLTDSGVSTGPYGSLLLAVIYLDGTEKYKLWYKFVNVQIPTGP